MRLKAFVPSVSGLYSVILTLRTWMQHIVWRWFNKAWLLAFLFYSFCCFWNMRGNMCSEWMMRLTLNGQPVVWTYTQLGKVCCEDKLSWILEIWGIFLNLRRFSENFRGPAEYSACFVFIHRQDYFCINETTDNAHPSLQPPLFYRAFWTQ